MNYRHEFHAGNFADVVKHAVLCRILMYLREKPAPFRVVDTHAGSGLYDLTGPEAIRTGEWQNGVGRLMNADATPGPAVLAMPEAARALLAPYVDSIAAINPGGRLAIYPGSPMLVRALLRRHDRLIACELEPQAAAALTARLRGDARAKAIAIDGWTALGAYIPPKERRGLVLIDPPFEAPDEFARLANALAAAHRKWATGTFVLWYPVKDDAEVAAFVRKVAQLGLGKTLRLELIAAKASAGLGLRGSGLIVVNPPWTLHDELQIMLPALAGVLSRSGKAATRLDWLTGETSR
jgi:23S rRNA (adenine2030-N6)-methyltransferase